MPLRLLVDESGDSRTLRRLLAAAGHTVVTPSDVGLLGARDPEIYAYAQAHGLVILTRNPRDFLRLYAEHPEHAGILLLYEDNDPTKDMSDADIVRAIGNVLAAGLAIAGAVHTLNHWRY